MDKPSITFEGEKLTISLSDYRNYKRTANRSSGDQKGRREKEFVFTLRKAKFNHYEANIIATEKLLLRRHADPLVVMAEKLNRHTRGKMIYTALQGWGVNLRRNRISAGHGD